MKWLIASVEGGSAPRVMSSTLHTTPAEAWAAVFVFDRVAGEWWRFLSKDYPADSREPYSDSVILGSIFRWTLVGVPE